MDCATLRAISTLSPHCDMDEPHKYSLWLEPDMESTRRLQKCINEVAESYNCEPFAPHMTLVGSATQADFQACARRWKEVTSSMVAKTLGLRSHNMLYQRLFIKLDVSLCASTLYTILGPKLRTQWRQRTPHVSLLYSNKDLESQTFEWLEIPENITFDRLSLWSTQGHYATWHRVHSETLH